MSTILKRPLDTFRGNNGEGVVQFRGIKYATSKDQLCVPEMVREYTDRVIDATRFGPRAPALDGCLFEQSVLIQCSLPVIPEIDVPPMSGTECLNLNITVPNIVFEDGAGKEVRGVGKKLPVMLFIHGGGFVMGANYWPQYDMDMLVKSSVEMGMPVIGVGINYRLGIPGNLTSKELRDAGYMGNNSLRDQKCALQWVRRNIGAFGGDGENVTVLGESAGAASVLYHLHSTKPLFKRCISMSGTPLMLRALSPAAAEMSYTSIMKEFGLEEASAEERIEAIRMASPEELVSKTPMSVPLLPLLESDILPKLSVPPLPSQDDTIVPEQMTFEKLAAKDHANLPGMQWCDSLMIGDCQHDGAVFYFMGLSQRAANIATTLCTSLHANLPPTSARAILQAYNITPSTPDDDAMQRIIDLATDIAYVAPTLAFARSFPGKTFYYQFNEPNPWIGAFEGKSTHMLDAAFLFQHFNEHMASGAQEVAKSLVEDFVKFANGGEPWAEFDEGMGQVRTYGPSEKSTIGAVDNNGWGNGRRDVLWKLSEEGKVDLDEVIVAWNMFIAGR